MRIVDAHLHVLDREWIPREVRMAWARQASGRRTELRDPAAMEARVMQRQSDPTGALTIAAFDRLGVDAGLIPVVDWTVVGNAGPDELTIEGLHDHHDRLAETTDGRLAFCAGLDPRQPNAREIAERSLERPACVGFKLYPAAGWLIDDPQYDWVFRFAAEHDRPIVIHTAPLGGDPLVTPNSRPAAIAPVMQRYPTIAWVFGHAGFEAWWMEAVDMAFGWQRCYLDLSLWQRSADFDYGEFRRRILLAKQRVGAHRLLFGSDIIRGPGDDADGAQLERWIDQFTALAEPYEGSPAVLAQEELELAMAHAAVDLYRLDEVRATIGTRGVAT
ncbi:putative TIM-barrel fold metal-dependent hydrolase [Ilumatobacter fluminis]|uniref:Putative TIM-barrel fold metal-dependent hydrolase n=1 Tax=Ilumatobacter fluminis TaxID=467091 RepID=A0A4R7I5I4_9ACTN|nr:amidohydrolase family protein [Ilumatobacter fluminis]TDT18259.1 putative TIM-barrel fold metal-dependent hydrolase [Ilumatobacter fluminis]